DRRPKFAGLDQTLPMRFRIEPHLIEIALAEKFFCHGMPPCDSGYVARLRARGKNRFYRWEGNLPLTAERGSRSRRPRLDRRHVGLRRLYNRPQACVPAFERGADFI